MTRDMLCHFSPLRDVFCEARILFPEEFRQTPDQYRFCWGVWFGHFIVGETIADNCRSNGWNRVLFVIARHLVLDDGEICDLEFAG